MLSGKSLITLLFLFSLLSLSAQTQQREQEQYYQQYPDECSFATKFYKKHKNDFERTGYTLGLSGKFLFSIIAPELSQFGHLSNKVETASLKVFYVQGGKKYSDFSIGFFQMKPSFIERMEDSLKQTKTMIPTFASCLLPNSGSREARVERLNRLNDFYWQLKYLTLFCALIQSRFSDIHFSNEEEKLRFYAAAYNTGFHKSRNEIEIMENKALFPHFSNSKYRYSEIALWFYSQH